mmetsp:Transcript_93353/g.302089  ORF Transcript_93353/g.302089 Transcript_93353/m.302089 type:complete len:313 (+) Transcript_93353:12180-13118(+)
MLFKSRSCWASEALGFMEGFVAGTQASFCNFSKAAVRVPVSLECFCSKWANNSLARLKSLSLMMLSASVTASSQLISCLMPQRRSTRQTASGLTPASASKSDTFARCAFTMTKASGLFSGSKDCTIVRCVPSAPGTHFTSDNLLPKSLISASFQDPAHSKNESKNGVSLALFTLETAGTTTSDNVLDGVRAPNTARKSSKIVEKAVSLFLASASVIAFNCSTSTPGSELMLRPGFSSCTLVSPSAHNEGATAQTSLLAVGGKTSLRSKSCLASVSRASAKGMVAGTHASLCNFSSAAARLPVNFSWLPSTCA